MNPAGQTILLVLAWGALATLAMTSILFIAQSLGWSRLNMPFLLGTFFTASRPEANVLGLMLYFMGGLLFAFVYFLGLDLVGAIGWWAGALAGFVHASLLLALALPMLPYMHPRMASEYEGPDLRKTLEPPGFLGLHYGYRTPLITVVAQVVYGAILGEGFNAIPQ